MKILKNRWFKVIIAVVAVSIIALCLVPIDVSVLWRSTAEAKSDTGELQINLEGKTELLGPDGQPLRVLSIVKYSMMPLSFFVGSKEVTAMKVTVSWSAEGQDIDWSTLNIEVYATGTGNYHARKTSNSRTGSVTFTLPISASRLGWTPRSGETVTWRMDINVKGTVKDVVGRPLTATAQPITCTTTTKWYQPSFRVHATASGSGVSVSSGSSSYSSPSSYSSYSQSSGGSYPSYSQSGSYGGIYGIHGGGCGGPGKHLVWVYNIIPITGIAERLQAAFYTLMLVEALLAIISVGTSRSRESR